MSDKDKVNEEAAAEQPGVGGNVYDVEDRFLAVGRPKEQPLVIGFVLLLIAGGVALWWTTRDSRAFTEANGENTAAAYQAYLAAWPEGEYAEAAATNIDDLTWEAHLAAGTFEEYLKAYHHGRHSRDARFAIDDRNFRQHKDGATLEKYIELYPTGRHVQRAKNELAKMAREKFEACTKVCWDVEQAKPEPDRETYGACCAEQCEGHMEEDSCKMGAAPVEAEGGAEGGEAATP